MTLRNRYFLLLDLALIGLAVFASFAVRFDTLSVWDYIAPNWFFLPLVWLIRLPIFYAFGIYRRLWRYMSVNEIVAVIEATLLGSAVAAVVILLGLPALDLIPGFPRSIILIEGGLTLFLIGGLRFSFRLTRHWQKGASGADESPAETKRRVLVFGAGDAGDLIVREMRTNPALGLEPVAFLDDDPGKRGATIQNLPVLGDRRHLADVVAARNIDLVVIAMPTAPGRVIREIAESCRQADVLVRTIPGLYEILGGAVKVSAIRQVQLEDLLRRDPVKIDLDQVGGYIGGTRVLVTGAGGSIGSELCRQIARFKPQKLILFDLSEHNLYQIHRELGKQFPALTLAPIIGDVRNREKVDALFAQEQPQVVFHAAAHKHVPMVEWNVAEAIATNVFGTRNVLAASARVGVGRFVLISTDKAVNPRSVMGATKRVAELLARDAAAQGPGVVVTVRFGNVLGSSGSVVPLFREQIAAGGPVTVTDAEVERYFMTIPEAVSLIIQAAALGKGGELFVLDMGEPVKISELARDLIRLSGFEPGEDIAITYTGLRVGEKLREELFAANEQPQRTTHAQIFAARTEQRDGAILHRALAELEMLVRAGDAPELRHKLGEVVPEYTVG